ncbi:MAG: helix-turn-helix domain-containing protein [Ectothiorhodospiraceae bacterium]|nr:helix-turn-helix domain-containing protein [Ectothiorhodospiraceae bacterium]
MRVATENRNGVIYAGCGWLVYLGPAPVLRPHRHPAVGLYVSLGQGFTTADGSLRALYAPPEMAVPELDPGGGPGAAILLGADNPLYPRLRRRYGDVVSEIAESGELLLPVLDDAYRQLPSGNDLVQRLAAAFDIPGQARAPDGSRDLLSLLDSPEESPPALTELAARLELSPRRVQSLFKEQTGLRYRRFILWQRLQAAANRIPEYRTLPDIAFAAGFADLAHLSRTFSRLFGLAPADWLRHARTLRFRRVHRSVE